MTEFNKYNQLREKIKKKEVIDVNGWIDACVHGYHQVGNSRHHLKID